MKEQQNTCEVLQGTTIAAKQIAQFDLILHQTQRFRLCGGDQGFPIALDLRMRMDLQGHKTHDVGGRPEPPDANVGTGP